VGRRWRSVLATAGEECAESEERGVGEETTRGKGALHPVGEDGAEKAVNGNTDDHAAVLRLLDNLLNSKTVAQAVVARPTLHRKLGGTTTTMPSF
jgi:hypothetical protein